MWLIIIRFGMTTGYFCYKYYVIQIECQHFVPLVKIVDPSLGTSFCRTKQWKVTAIETIDGTPIDIDNESPIDKNFNCIRISNEKCNIIVNGTPIDQEYHIDQKFNCDCIFHENKQIIVDKALFYLMYNGIQTTYSGTLVLYDPNVHKKIVAHCLDGLLHGTCIRFYDDDVVGVVQFVNGNLHGKCVVHSGWFDGYVLQNYVDGIRT